MSKKCEIIFNNYESRMFFGGDTVKGRVILMLPKSTPFEELVLRIKGVANCRWLEDNILNSTSYMGKEIIIEKETSLMRKNNELTEMSEGNHSYDFSFVLPENAPSSFVCDNGLVKYTAKVIIRHSVFFLNTTFSFPFNVMAKIDLNAIPRASESFSYTLSNHFNFVLFRRGIVDFTVSMPKMGFVPGQKAPISCRIINESEANIYAVRFSFIQSITLNAHHPVNHEKYKTNKMLSWDYNEFENNDDFSFTIDNFIIPKILPTSFDTCTVIDITYNIRIKIKVSGLYRNMSFYIPIIIGTVPVESDDTDSMDTEPPSYEEAVRN